MYRLDKVIFKPLYHMTIIRHHIFYALGLPISVYYFLSQLFHHLERIIIEFRYGVLTMQNIIVGSIEEASSLQTNMNVDLQTGFG
jgi:hypothetical protein